MAWRDLMAKCTWEEMTDDLERSCGIERDGDLFNVTVGGAGLSTSGLQVTS